MRGVPLLCALALLQVLPFLVGAVSVQDLATALEVQTVEHQVLLDSSVVVHAWKATFKNLATEPATEVFFCTTQDHAEHLALAFVQLGEGTQAKGHYASAAQVDGVPAGIVCYNAPMQLDNKPLPPGKTATLSIMLAFTHLLTPSPATVTHGEPQRMLYEGNMHPLLPYAIQSVMTQVKLQSKEVESYTRKVGSPSRQGQYIQYGPFSDLPPFSLQPLRVHAPNNAPFAVATELVREIEVSHWGNVYVEEKYQLRHSGAKLKGSWSRLDYQIKPEQYAAGSFRELIAELPGDAHSLYFRDDIGNVSSSFVRTSPGKVMAMLLPRFPLFGGWSCDFVFGYSLPLASLVSKLDDGALVLNTMFGPSIRGVITDALTVKVVLPEGAMIIKAELPYATNQTSDTKFTYLDTVGRPVQVLTKENVIDSHNTALYVVYRMPAFAMLREPLLLVGAFALFFASIMVYVRCEFTISRDDKWVAAQEQQKATLLMGSIANVINDCHRIIRELDGTLVSGDLAAAQQAKTDADASLKTSSEQLKELARDFEGLVAGRAGQVRELLDKERALQTACAQLYARKAQLLKDGINAWELPKEPSVVAQENRVADARKEVLTLSNALLEAY